MAISAHTDSASAYSPSCTTDGFSSHPPAMNATTATATNTVASRRRPGIVRVSRVALRTVSHRSSLPRYAECVAASVASRLL